MADLQERLLRASAVARLDEIVQALKSSSDALSSAHRQWLTELLVPFATSADPQRLTSHSQRPKGDALITVLLESTDVEASFGKLTELHVALAKAEPLDSALRTFALELALSLRKCLLRANYSHAVRANRERRLGLMT